jgi:hypothetical protein
MKNRKSRHFISSQLSIFVKVRMPGALRLFLASAIVLAGENTPERLHENS